MTKGPDLALTVASGRHLIGHRVPPLPCRIFEEKYKAIAMSKVESDALVDPKILLTSAAWFV